MIFNNSQKLLAGILSLVLVVGMTNSAFAQTTPGLAVDVIGDTICPVGEVLAGDICICDASNITANPALCVDVDNDQILDDFDLCVPSPPGAMVDPDGCSDEDQDLVEDSVDQCLDTPPQTLVDEFGCPIKPVAGELLALDSSALVIGGLSSMMWMIPAVAGIAGAGLYLVKFRVRE